MHRSARISTSGLRQGVPPELKSDTGAIPPAMLNDLRRLLWRMEKPPLYWAIGMAVVFGLLWLAGVLVFLTADQRRPGIDHTAIAIGAASLTVVVALLYSPFLSRCDTRRFEAKWLRQVLHSQRLEDLAFYMSVCRMGSREWIADEILPVWLKHGLEPGWAARQAEPPQLFR